MNWPWVAIPPGDLITAVGLTCRYWEHNPLVLGSSRKTPAPQSTAVFAIERGIREQWRKQQIVRRRLARVSLAVIVLGFLLQAVAVIG